MPYAVGLFTKKSLNFYVILANEIRCLRNGCPKVVAAKELIALWRTSIVLLGSSELRLIAHGWLQVSFKNHALHCLGSVLSQPVS